MLLIRIVCIAALLASVLTEAPSQLRTFWQDVGGAPGPKAICEGLNGRIISGTKGSGVYLSDDDGATWYQSTQKTNEFRQLFRAGNDIIADAVFSPYFLRSTDNGVSWRTLPMRYAGGYIEFISAAQDGSLYALGTILVPNSSVIDNRKIVKFNGTSWDSVSPPPPYNQIYNTATTILVNNESEFFVGTRSGLYTSTNGGMTWKLHFQELWFSRLARVNSDEVYVGANPTSSTDGGLFMTTDVGATWSQFGFTGKTFAAVTKDNRGRLIAGTMEGVYTYDAEAEAWSAFELPPYLLREVSVDFRERESYFASGGVFSASSGTLFAGGPDGGMYRSTDYGATWRQNSPRRKDIYSILPIGASTVLIGTLGGGVFRSTDEGANWNQVSSEGLCSHVFDMEEVGDVVFAGTDCGVYASLDEGLNWNHVSRASFESPVNAIAVDAGRNIFAASTFGMYVLPTSTDPLHDPWQARGLSGKNVTSVTASADGGIFAATTTDGVYASTDLGATWRLTSLRMTGVQTLAASPAGDVFAGVHGGIYRSTDQGLTWNFADIDPSYTYAIATGENGIMYAATYHYPYQSMDDGATWNRMDISGLRQPVVLSLRFDGRGRLYAGTYRGSVYRSARTLTETDDGWSARPEFSLDGNFPNPFNPSTTIRFRNDRTQRVVLTVHSLLGQELARLIDEVRPAGEMSVVFDASTVAGGIPSGVYLTRLKTETGQRLGKMLYIR